MPLYDWSQTANSNASADPTINWAEGQAPSSLNDSARAMMAATAMYRDDIAGAIVTSGSSTAYTVASYSVYDTLAHLNGQMIAFTPHATNAAGPVSLNVDGLGAKPLRSSPNVELLAGTIVQGTPYVALYNSSDSAFYLQGFYPQQTTFNIPLAGGMDFWGSTVPNSSFAFPIGQAISRTTYATLFSIMSTTYGTGDGSTTFNLPDKTGRISAMQEASSTRLTSTYFGGNSTALGAVGGVDHEAIGQTNLPNVNFTVSGITLSGFTILVNNGAPSGGSHGIQGSNGGGNAVVDTANQIGLTISSQGVAASGGSGTPLPIVQPTIICNYIIRII